MQFNFSVIFQNMLKSSAIIDKTIFIQPNNFKKKKISFFLVHFNKILKSSVTRLTFQGIQYVFWICIVRQALDTTKICFPNSKSSSWLPLLICRVSNWIYPWDSTPFILILYSPILLPKPIKLSSVGLHHFYLRGLVKLCTLLVF